MIKIIYNSIFSLFPSRLAQIASIGRITWLAGGSDSHTPYHVANYTVGFIAPEAGPEAEVTFVPMPIRPAFSYVPGAMLDSDGHFSAGELKLPAGCQFVDLAFSYQNLCVIDNPACLENAIEEMRTVMPSYMPTDVPFGSYAIRGSAEQLLISRNVLDRALFCWNAHLADAVITRNLPLKKIMDLDVPQKGTVEINPHVILSEMACTYMATIAMTPSLTKYYNQRHDGYLPWIPGASLVCHGIRYGNLIFVTKLRISQIPVPFQHLIRDARKKPTVYENQPDELPPVPNCNTIKVNSKKASSEDLGKVRVDTLENITKTLLANKPSVRMKRNEEEGSFSIVEPKAQHPHTFDAEPLEYSAQPQGDDGLCLPELAFRLIPDVNGSCDIQCAPGYAYFSFLVNTCNDLQHLGSLKNCRPIFGCFPPEAGCGLANRRYALICAMWRSRAVYIFDTDLSNRYALLGIPMEFQISDEDLAQFLCSALCHAGGHWRDDAGKVLHSRFERLRHCHSSRFAEAQRWQRHLDKLLRP